MAGLEAQLGAARDEPIWLREQLQERAAELASQRAINQQLMAKKEEVEWWVAAQTLGLAAGVTACLLAGLDCSGLHHADPY